MSSDSQNRGSSLLGMALEQQQRARSYSTNNALSNPTYLLSNGNSLSQMIQPTQTASLLGNHMTRLRAQTVSTRPDMSLQPHNSSEDTENLKWTTSLQDTALGPTRTLCIMNLPSSVTDSTLHDILKNFGLITSIKLIQQEGCALVEFDTVDSSMEAKVSLNHLEFVPGVPCITAFAKYIKNVQQKQQLIPPALETQLEENDQEEYEEEEEEEKEKDAVKHAPELSQISDDLIAIYEELDSDNRVYIKDAILIAETNNYEPDFPALPITNSRQTDSSQLRDFRRRLDTPTATEEDGNEIANTLMSEIDILASDYLGNTIVQKLFELCSIDVRLKIIEKLSSFMASIGIHKNGTWAVQKLINVAQSSEEQLLISKSLQPYTKLLFNDQFGNYVLQGCLKFSPPYNNFIYDGIMSGFHEVSLGRFGARAIRACLESSFSSKQQILTVVALVSVYFETLCFDSNGGLLISWLLESDLKQSYTVISKKLINMERNKFIDICTNKIGSAAVLKVIGNKDDVNARNAVLHRIFPTISLESVENTKDKDADTDKVEDENENENENENKNENEVNESENENEAVLETILQDASHGPTFIYKILTSSSSFWDQEQKAQAITLIRNVLITLNVNNNYYRRLFDEVGLPNQNQGTGQGQSKRHHHHHHGYGNGNGNGNPNVNNNNGNNSVKHRGGARGYGTGYQDYQTMPYINQLQGNIQPPQLQQYDYQNQGGVELSQHFEQMNLGQNLGQYYEQPSALLQPTQLVGVYQSSPQVLGAQLTQQSQSTQQGQQQYYGYTNTNINHNQGY